MFAFQKDPETNRVFDSNFKDRYSGDKFNYEGEKIVTRTPRGSGDYKEYDEKETRVREDDDSGVYYINLGPIGWLFVIIMIGAVGYLIYTLINEGGTGLFASKRHKSIKDYDEITAENIEHADIHALIKKAESDNDYRLAIRYYYLLVLKTLTLKKHIKFEDDKTNAEYLNELSEKPFSTTFAYTSYLYNYIWYGKFALDNSQYDKAKHNFTNLLNQVG